jgi:EpsG family
MFPYIAMLALPAVIALFGAQRVRPFFYLVALVYFLMVGFRFQVGMDWNNYLLIYDYWHNVSLGKNLAQREPGYGALMWIAGQLGSGMVLVDAVSGAVFTLGLFAVAKRCREPFIAICIATPLLVVASAMSSVRQAIAQGILFYLMATWYQRNTLTRTLLVFLAAAFHFSAIFMLIFVSLAAKVPAVVRVGGAIFVGAIVLATISFAPDAMEHYSNLYVGPSAKLTAPGAIVETGVVAAAAVLFFAVRPLWDAVYEDNPLYRNMAWASLLSLPAILISSVGAYRFVLYFYPMAMTYYSGAPGLIRSGVGRLWYRMAIVAASFAMLVGWLMLGNNSVPWVPYKNWLLQPEGAQMFRHAPYKRL